MKIDFLSFQSLWAVSSSYKMLEPSYTHEFKKGTGELWGTAKDNMLSKEG